MCAAACAAGKLMFDDKLYLSLKYTSQKCKSADLTLPLYYYLGSCRVRLSDFMGAVEALNEAVPLMPRDGSPAVLTETGKPTSTKSCSQLHSTRCATAASRVCHPRLQRHGLDTVVSILSASTLGVVSSL